MTTAAATLQSYAITRTVHGPHGAMGTHTVTFRPYDDGRIQVCSHSSLRGLDREAGRWAHMERRAWAKDYERELLSRGYTRIGFEDARAAGLFTAPSWPSESVNTHDLMLNLWPAVGDTLADLRAKLMSTASLRRDGKNGATARLIQDVISSLWDAIDREAEEPGTV